MQNAVLKNNLKLHRTLRGLTQEELAIAVNVTRKTINVIEAGNYSPSVLLALNIAAVLESSVEELFYIERR